MYSGLFLFDIDQLKSKFIHIHIYCMSYGLISKLLRVRPVKLTVFKNYFFSVPITCFLQLVEEIRNVYVFMLIENYFIDNFIY